MKMGVCAHSDDQKRFLCEIKRFKHDFNDFFSNIKHISRGSDRIAF